MHEALNNVSIEFFIVHHKNFSLIYIFPFWARQIIETLNLIIWKTVVNHWWHLQNLAIKNVLSFRNLSYWGALFIIYRGAFFNWESIIIWRHENRWRLNNRIRIHYVNKTFIFSQNYTKNKSTAFSLIWNHSNFSTEKVCKVLAYNKPESNPLSIHLFWILNRSKQLK